LTKAVLNQTIRVSDAVTGGFEVEPSDVDEQAAIRVEGVPADISL
jgi:hypothetical protein